VAGDVCGSWYRQVTKSCGKSFPKVRGISFLTQEPLNVCDALRTYAMYY